MTTIPATSPGPSGVRFRDLLPRADADQALAFLDALHRDAAGWIALTLISRGRAGVRTGADLWPDGRRRLVDDPDWWSFCADTHARWDVYTAVASFSRPPAKGSRGLTRDVLELPGVFADLDVKPDQEGVFGDRSELTDFLTRLPEPSVRVATGSGGEHVYWLTHERVADPAHRAKLLDGWYDYLTVVAGRTGHVVDHVQEPARILRVPGTVRWPRDRATDVGRPMPVTLERVDGPRYDVRELLELVEPHRQAAVDRHEEHRLAWRSDRDARVAWLEGLGLRAIQRTMLEERFNREEDWEQLLVPAGWRLARDRRDGSGTSTDCRYWTRPGKEVSEGGSASTDSPRGAPGVMYVYTTDPLLDPCLIPDGNRFRRLTTKYHFALHFLFAGDEARLLESIINGGGRLA